MLYYFETEQDVCMWMSQEEAYIMY